MKKHETLTDLVARGQARRVLPEPDIRRALRERVGLTQAEVAVAIGVDRTTVCRWETSDRTPRQPHLDRYAEVLDCFVRAVGTRTPW